MSYTFSPIRFSVIIFVLTILAAMASMTILRTTGLRIGSGALAALPFLIAIGIESRLFGKALRAAPEKRACNALAWRMALSGTATYLIIMAIGIILIRGEAAFADLTLWLEPGVMVLALGGFAYLAAIFVVPSIAKAMLKGRA